MRWTVLLLLLPALSGCLGEEEATEPLAGLVSDCPMDGEVTLFFGPDLTLVPGLPAAGVQAGNGFEEAFLSNVMDEWTSPPVEHMVHIMGDLRLQYWSRGHDMVAPVILGGDPGEGYHWFNQVGTNRGFVESYAVEYAPVRDEPTVRAWNESFAMPEGGLYLEPGDHLRVLLTNLVLDEPGGRRGPDILYGGQTPSSVSFEAHCVPIMTWQEGDPQVHSVQLPVHHGLLTGAVPAQEGLNHVTVPFTLDTDTARLTIRLDQSGGPNPTKDDMDLTVLDANGDQVWSIGSPYSDEVGTKWPLNLAATMPPGVYSVRVDSYSGVAYDGTLSITQDRLSG